MVKDPSENRVPTYDALFNPTLEAIRSLGGSASISEITNQVIEGMKLPDQVTQIVHGQGRQTELEYRLAWSRTYLKQYGLLNNSERGIWSLTASGPDTKIVEPSAVVTFVRQQFQEGRAKSELAAGGKNLLGDKEEWEDDYSEDTDSWRERLLGALQKMPPDSFERLCQRLLRESGFIEVEVTGRSGDGGIDGRGVIRFAGLISFPVLFQCKRYSSNVGPAIVRELRGAMQGRSDRGLILTTAGFTRDAHQEATRDGAPPIDLIDGELLMDKLRELKLGVSTCMIEEITVDTGWFNSL